MRAWQGALKTEHWRSWRQRRQKLQWGTGPQTHVYMPPMRNQADVNVTRQLCVQQCSQATDRPMCTHSVLELLDALRGSPKLVRHNSNLHLLHGAP